MASKRKKSVSATVYTSFLRHVKTLTDAIDYPDVSKHGSRVANAYRLARQELRKLMAEEQAQ